jgi:hypothetical protein
VLQRRIALFLYPGTNMLNRRFVLLITGAREWDNPQIIENALREYRKIHLLNLLVIHGHCPWGADSQADKICKRLGIDRVLVPANWEGRGNPAGPERNRLMEELIEIDEVLAFHDNLERSKGTKDMVKIAQNANIPVNLYTTKNTPHRL